MSDIPARILAVAACAVALYGWIRLESTGDVGPGLGWFAAAFGGYGALVPALADLCQRDGLRERARAMRTSKPTDPTGQQWRSMGWTRRRIVLLPLAIVPLMALSLPIAFHAQPGDWSIIGVLVVVGVLVGPFCVVLGSLTWVMVVLPLLWLGAFGLTTLRSRDIDERFAVGMAVALIGVDIVVTGLVTAGAHLGRSRLDVVIALFRGGPHPALLWLARGGIVLIVVGLLVIRTAKRLHEPWSGAQDVA